MDDLISRQAGIDGINRLFCPIGGCNFYDEEQKKLYDNGVDDALQVIEELPAAQPVHNTTLSDVLTYFDSLKENEDAWTEFCACLECRGWDIVPAKRYNDEAREIFMAIVYDELYSDGDNNRANRIIDAADEYVEYSLAKQSAQLGTNLAEVGTDCISRQAAIDICANAIDLWRGQLGVGALIAVRDKIKELPPAQQNLSEEYAKAVRNWLVNYQVKCADLAGRYTPYEVLGWIVSDWRKENGIW